MSADFSLEHLEIYKPQGSQNLLIYVNPGYNTFHGHYLAQLKALEQGARAGLFDLCHLAHERSEETAHSESPINPCFNFFPEIMKYGSEKEILDACDDFRRKFRKILEIISPKLSAYRKVSFYQFTGHPFYSHLYKEVIPKGKVGETRVSVINNYLYREDENERDDSSKNLEKVAFVRTSKAANAHWIRNASDSQKYQQILSNRYNLSVDYLPFPLPLTINVSQNERNSVRSWLRRVFTSENQPHTCKVLYLGYPHKKWGYRDAFALYQELVEKQNRSDVHFTVRHQHVHGDPKGYALRDEWISKEKYITHLAGYLDSDTYNQAISNANVVLLPYHPQFYKYATSGVFVESVLQNKIVVSTEGTWMADELKKAKCGKTYPFGDVQSLQTIIKELRKSLPMETKKMTKLARAYRHLYSIRRFSETVFSSN